MNWEELNEIFEAHEMTDISVIFHTDTLYDHLFSGANWHENLELLYFRQGNAAVKRQEEVYQVKAGDIVVFPANFLHCVSAPDYVLYDCLIIDRALALRSGIDTSTLLFPAVIRDEKLQSLFSDVREAVELPEKDAYRVAQVHGTVLSLLSYLCRRYGQPMAEGSSHSLEGIKKALRYIREHIAENLTVDVLAEVAGFSRYYFVRAFKRATSYTVITYINRVRVEKAKKLFHSGETAVSAVALECGFNNLSYFSKVFHTYTGLTPSQYVHSALHEKGV